MNYYLHPTAEVAKDAYVGENTKIWHLAQIREKAIIGKNCIIGKNAYIDFSVTIGNNCKIQNNASVFHGAAVEDGVFIGPNVVITNDKYPRAINKDGALKGSDDWQTGKTTIKYGASIGAHSVILPNVNIGRFAVIGAGSVITKDVPDFGLVYGNPGRLIGYVDEEGSLLKKL